MFNPPHFPSEIEWALLDGEEQRRADRFKRQSDRSRYIWVRSILKRLIATYLNRSPNQVILDYGVKGKPLLVDANDEQLEFNVSHSHDLVLWAFSRCQAVGVDVEYIKPNHQGLPIAKRFFTSREYQALCSRAVAEQEDFFFQLWTRKEACIKAKGQSLFEQIRHLEVPTMDCCTTEWSALVNSDLSVRDLSLDPSYKASIASFSSHASLSCFKWEI